MPPARTTSSSCPPGPPPAAGSGAGCTRTCSAPTLQIDGNFGLTAGIAELLLGSHSGVLELLPALPQTWPAGRVRGLRARGGLEVDVSWRSGALTEARFRAAEPTRLAVRWPGGQDELTLLAGVEQVLTPGPRRSDDDDR